MNGRMEVDMKRDEHTESLLKDLPGFISEWYMALQASRKTSATRRDYIYKAQKYLQTINTDTKAISTTDITYQSVIRYFTSIQKKQNSDGTWSNTSDSYQQTVWACLNSLLGFMSKLGYIKQNYMELIDKPKNRDLDRINQHRVVLTKEDFSEIQLASKCGAGNDLARERQEQMRERDEAILTLLMTTGMRCTALLEINVEDLNQETHELTVIDKREKFHTYKLSESVMGVVNNWIKKREEFNCKDSAMFISNRRVRLSPNGITKIVKKYTDEAVGKGLSPHKLRSGFVTILYNETHDLNFCRAAVGHSNVATTQRYIASNNTEKAKANEMISSFLM